MRDKKVVQTEVDPRTYARLRHLAERRSKPIKAIAREALAAYVAEQEGDVDQDALFQLVGRLEVEGKDWSVRKDWRP